MITLEEKEHFLAQYCGDYDMFGAFFNKKEEIIAFVQLPARIIEKYWDYPEFNQIPIPFSMDKSLPFSENFIQLSYIPNFELGSRKEIESQLLIKENESNSKKTNYKYSSSKKFLHHEYISNYLFNRDEKLIILGTPGVGKTTFAHWLCNTWANQKKQIVSHQNDSNTAIPIYINLRKVDFTKEDGILEYLRKNYLETQIQTLNNILKYASKKYYLILDGLDELVFKNREKLLSELNQISPDLNYIILSRPYGLLDNPGFTWTSLIQLDGFNESNIQSYVSSFFRVYNRENSDKEKQLLKLLDSNPILADYAHTPLMLAYIVSIAIFSDNVEEILNNIQTRFQLQKEVINWLKSHHDIKGLNSFTEAFKAQYDDIKRFSFWLTIKKSVEYNINGVLDNWLPTIDTLKNLGFGSQDYDSTKFTFNSITFQEYFSADLFRNYLTNESFSILLKDNYYSNFVAMLLGSFDEQTQQGLIQNISVPIIEESISDNPQNDFKVYQWLSLLSETRGVIIDNSFENGIINPHTLYSFYHLSLYNPKWFLTVADAIYRIYFKASENNKKHIKEYLKATIIDLLKTADTLIDDEIHGKTNDIRTENTVFNQIGHEFPESLRLLLIELKLYKDIEFTEWYAELAIELSKKLAFTPDNSQFYQHITVYYDLLINFFEFITQSSNIVLSIIKPKVIQIAEAANEELKIHILEAQVDIDFFSKDFNHAWQSLQQTIDKIPNYSEPLHLIETTVDFNSCAKQINKYPNLISDFYTFANTYVDALFNQFDNLINENIEIEEVFTNDEFDSSKDETVYFIKAASILIKGLIENGSKEALQVINQILLRNYDALFFDTTFKFKDDSIFSEYIQEQLNDRTLTFENKARTIFAFVSTFANAQINFYAFREIFWNIISKYIQENKPALMKMGAFDSEDNELSIMLSPLVDLALDNNSFKEYDKRYIIGNFIENELYEIKYIKEYIIFAFLQGDIRLYTAQHWLLLEQYLNEKVNNQILVQGLEILVSNKFIYLYPNNLTHLIGALQLFVSKYQSLKKASTELRLITVVSFCLQLLKKANKGAVTETQKDNLLSICYQILSKKDLMQALLEDDANLEIDDYLAYILLYFYAPSATIKIQIDYSKVYEYDRSTFRSLLAKLEDLFDSSELYKLSKDLFCSPFAEYINELLERRNEENYELNIYEFKKTLPEISNDFLNVFIN